MNTKFENKKTAAKTVTPDKLKYQVGTKLVCVKFCQATVDGQIVTYDRGHKLTVTEDTVYPADCFKEYVRED